MERGLTNRHCSLSPLRGNNSYSDYFLGSLFAYQFNGPSIVLVYMITVVLCIPMMRHRRC